MARPGKYIFQRGKVWWVKLQFSPEMQVVAAVYKDTEVPADWRKSLETEDELVALARAARYIAFHKEIKFIKAAVADRDNKWTNLQDKPFFKPGQQTKEDGTVIVSDANTVVVMPPDGGAFKMAPNAKQLVITEYSDTAKASTEYRELVESKRTAHRVGKIDLDEKIVENYLTGRKKQLRKDDVDATRRTLEDWRLVAGKFNFATADRPDAQALVDHLQDVRELSPQRTKKLIAYIKAAITYETVTNPKKTPIKHNIFASLQIVDEDEEGENKRPPYSEEQVTMIKANRDRFTDEQYLMLAWHVASSVRPGGIYSIVRDGIENGDDDEGTVYTTRFVKITRDKGKYGRRCLPIPQAVLDLKKQDGSPLLPDTIEGCLFKTPLAQLLVGINKKLVTIGVNVGDGMTLYSGRHRAKDRMLNRDVHEERRRVIMGHAFSKDDAHQDYGHGFSMWKLKPAIDKIGF